MPDEMSEHMERQLAAFGRTLAGEAGEPIERDGAGSSASSTERRPVRRWAVVGAAACLVLVVVGIGLAARNRGSVPSGPAATVGSTQTDGGLRELMPAPDVPVDALRLDDAGWTLIRHSRSAFVVIDAMACDEMLEFTSAVGHEVVTESYDGPTDPAFMTVTHVRYPDRETALERVAPFADLRVCEQEDLTGYEQLDLDAGAGITGSGHRQRGSAQVAFVADDGVAVMVRVGNDDSDATLQLLAGQAAAFLRGELGPQAPDATTTVLDDLAALVGEDPVGLVAGGWSRPYLYLGPFETSAWPVCWPPAPVSSIAGAASYSVSYTSPSGDERVNLEFVRVDDPALRADLGTAFVAESTCPPSSQPDLGREVAVEADPNTGRWRRSDAEATSSLVAPPGDDVLPLVAIVSGDAARVDELADRAAALFTATAPEAEPVPTDPLGLERDGWTLVQRTDDPFDYDAGSLPVACPQAAALEGFDGVPQVVDMLERPALPAVNVLVLDVGSVDAGNELAAAFLAIADCAGEAVGAEATETALSSIRATWFRAGSELAIATVVGEGQRTVVLALENGGVTDDLIAELAHRADEFLRTGQAASTPGHATGITVTPGPTVGQLQTEPVAGQVKLWVSNQSFGDDPAGITITIDGVQIVDDQFFVESQHNWISYFVDGLEPGEHTLVATSDTGAGSEFSFTLPEGEPRWLVVDYWNDSDEAAGPMFTFRESDAPVEFA